MNFLIADTFTDSLARLTSDEQKLVKTTAFDLQLDPKSPGLSFHRLDKARDKSFWSVRVGSDLRLIVHRQSDRLLLCYVDHHDKAYDWAERRKLQTHPTTGAAQLIEIRETVQQILLPLYVNSPATPAPLFTRLTDEELLGYGVPPEWLPDVRKANEDSLLTLATRLPGEAAEALLELATGGKPRPQKPQAQGADPFTHPDAQRRFRVISDVETLQRALDAPWERWVVFLHPEQQQIVERRYSGPARVSGSAGTGKTIVALHRAVHLARRDPDARVLLTTFSPALANALHNNLRRLCHKEPRLMERIDVHALDDLGLRLYQPLFGKVTLAPRARVQQLLAAAAQQAGATQFSAAFLSSEWEQVVDASQLTTWEAYRDVARLGRKTKRPEAQRVILWSVFAKVQDALRAAGLITSAGLFTRLAAALAERERPPFDHVVVDEAQDVSVSQLRFFASLGKGRPDGLFFAGDIGQRIFQPPFSWLAQGVDIRGRAQTLRVNYRTTHQIRRQADRLLGREVSDADSNTETRGDTISLFNGPRPEILALDEQEQEGAQVGAWIAARLSEGRKPHEIGVFVRSAAQLPRACAAVKRAGAAFKILDESVETHSGHVSISTMHLAKGLEFRAVVVMACDDQVIPSQERMETAADDVEMGDVHDTERQLLYVACTRARDELLVTSAGPASEFLDDMV